MKKRAFPVFIALALILCVFCVSALTAGAETPEEIISIDVSDHVLQAGGLLAQPPAQQKVARGDPNAAVKQAIYDGLCAWQQSINISAYNVSINDIGQIYESLLNEHPDLFYVFGVMSYSYSNSSVFSVIPSYDTSYTDADVQAYRSTVQQIVGMIEPGWSDVEKLLFLHDYLVTHCEYDLSYQRHNAHDALVVGRAVCQGYTLAFIDLCRRSGIACAYISSETIDHAWNLVTVGGARYYVDCTWDDPSNSWYEGYCRHENFLISKSALAATSTPHEGTDWTDGTVNVYENVATSTLYDGAWWRDVITAVPFIGHVCAYTLEDDSDHIYLRDMSSSSVTTVALPDSAVWPVWGSSNLFGENYSSAAALGSSFYFTLPTEIWSLSLAGQTSCVYQLAQDELAQGYVYGIVKDGGSLFYSIGTQPSNTSFVRSAFQPGPVTGERDGFTYLVLADGTASITACSLSGEIDIPGELDGYTVSNLAQELFSGKRDITAVTIPATVTGFGDDPSDNTGDLVFTDCFDLTRIDVAADNPSFSSEDGILFNKDKSALIQYPCSRSGDVYHTEADYLCYTSFASNLTLKFLFIDNPDSTWDTYPFYNSTDLTAFYIPGGATAAKVAAEQQSGTDPDARCTMVSTDALCYMPMQLQVIEEDAFQGTNIPYLIAPQACERVKQGAFVNSGLVYLRVGANTVIEDGALPDAAVVERQ